MSFKDSVISQFIDVIEYVDTSDKILVKKYERYKNEIKQGAKLIVRESQAAVFLKNGKCADVFEAGSYLLKTDNLPILSTLGAISHLFNSPIKSDLYFVSTKQFVANKWETPNPIMLRDSEFGLVRIRAFGSYSFRVVNALEFMKEIIGTQHLVLTYPILEYLTSILLQSVALEIAQIGIPAIDLALHYKEISENVIATVNVTSKTFGIEFTNIAIENISLPQEVEKYIDEQSGIGMANKDMASFVKYQSLRAMRDAAKQKGGLAGLGAGFALGNNMMNGIADASSAPCPAIKIRCTACSALNDDESKFCSKCGNKL